MLEIVNLLDSYYHPSISFLGYGLAAISLVLSISIGWIIWIVVTIADWNDPKEETAMIMVNFIRFPFAAWLIIHIVYILFPIATPVFLAGLTISKLRKRSY